MIETGKSYVYGTTAEKLNAESLYEEKANYDVYEKNHLLKAKREARRESRLHLKQVLVVFTAFTVCFFVLFRYSVITESAYKELELMKQYEELKNNNIRLKMEIDQSMDINRIEEVAKAKLGMQRPAQYQIVYVKVPKNDHTETVDKQKDGEQSSFFAASLIDKVNKLVNYLY